MRALGPLLVTALLWATVGCNHAGPAAPGTPGSELDFSEFDEAVSASLVAQGLEGAAAVVVDRERGIVHLKGYGAFETDRLFLIASSSKPLSVGILMRLADQGLLDMDAPIGTYLSDRWGDEKASLTLAQLVSNSSGMVGLLDNPAYQPYICQYQPGGTLDACARTIYDAADADRIDPPDTRFRYGGGQWQLAGGVAALVSGKSWERLVRETYIEPCGTASLGYANPFEGALLGGYPDSFHGDTANLPDTENPNIEGGAYITAEDYGKILLMHLRGGLCGGTRVLSEAAVGRMQRDRIDSAYGGRTGQPTLQGYGLGWWVDRTSPGAVASPGFYGAMPWLDGRRGYAALILLEAGGAERDRLWAEVRPALDAVFETSND